MRAILAALLMLAAFAAIAPPASAIMHCGTVEGAVEACVAFTTSDGLSCARVRQPTTGFQEGSCDGGMDMGGSGSPFEGP